MKECCFNQRFERRTKMELWDIYDENRRLTGKTMVRGDEFIPGDYHLIVHICLFNALGQMLIQQRQLFKDGWPGKWDVTVGGSAVAGEDSRMAAEREVFEEIGYKLDLSGVRPSLTTYYKDGFDDIYLLEREPEITELKLQAEEVKDVRWAEKNEILSLIKQGEFIPYFDSFIEYLFAARKSGGGIKRFQTPKRL